MSLLDRIRSAFSGKSEGAAHDTSRVYIVDGDRITEGNERPGPAERFQILQRLARFADREKVQMQVVLGGRALREVAHGDEFNGLKVYYSEQVEAIADQIMQLYQGSRRDKAVVITSDPQLETRVLEQGGALMKSSTLRKGLEGGNGGGGGEEYSGRHGRRRDRGRRGDRGDRGDRRGGDRRPDQQESREAASSSESSGQREPGGETTVKNLIDLVE